MKNFNNWVKSVLIKEHCKQGYNVLDLCSGKGGDLLKFNKASINHYVAADLAHNSVMDVINRYNSLQNITFSATFVSANCCKVRLADKLPPNLLFDLVNCQFALHYSFESEEYARGLLRNVSDRLKPGGHFIGTIPNANYLVKKIRSSNSLEFGNNLYKIQFFQKDNFTEPFGCRYLFSLKDAIDNCPEYLVHFPTLVKLAGEYDLELVMKDPFHSYIYQKSKPDNQENFRLLMKINALNEEGTISEEEWEALGIYLVFVFRKRLAPNQATVPPNAPLKKTTYTHDDIIVFPEASSQE